MRRILAFVLAAFLLLPTTYAITDTRQVSAASKAEKTISALGIMTTDKGVISSTTTKITRSQYAQLLVNMSALKDTTAVTSNISLFSDVSKKYWAAGYIKTAVSNGWMYGYLNGTFKPGQAVTLYEAVNGVLKLLGYTDSDFSGNVADNKMALYSSKSLDKNITVYNKSSALSYSNCVNLFYNVLNATTKEGKVYAVSLGYSLDADGALDYVSLINADTEGPIIADNTWKSQLPFAAAAATYYLDGEKCSISDIEENDVLYYSEKFSSVWAYDNQVTGTVEAINPDYLAPESVTVSGKTYTLGTSEMAEEFSSMGSVKEGDMLTLLLGKSDVVAGVVTEDELNAGITGVVLSTGTHLVKNSDGEYESTEYATFVDAAGNSYTQDYDLDLISFEKENLIRVTYNNGEATVSKPIQYSVPFTSSSFSSDAGSIGGYQLASNVKILDLAEDEYVTVYPERLAGVTLGTNSVYYYELNQTNEITQLILCDVTGDMKQYGIFTGIGSASSSGRVIYNYIVDGTANSATVSTMSKLVLDEGPVSLTFKNSSLYSTAVLTGVKATSVGKITIQSSNAKYPLASNCDVYILADGEYVATTIDKVMDLTKYNVTAYYDNAISVGGRIRMIIAKSIN